MLNTIPNDVMERFVVPLLSDRDVANLAAATHSPTVRECAARTDTAIIHRFARFLGEAGFFSPGKRRYHSIRVFEGFRLAKIPGLPHEQNDEERQRYSVGSPDLDALRNLRVEMIIENAWPKYPTNVDGLIVDVFFEDGSEAPLRFTVMNKYDKSSLNRHLFVSTRPVLVLKPHAEDVIRAFEKGLLGRYYGMHGFVARQCGWATDPRPTRA